VESEPLITTIEVSSPNRKSQAELPSLRALSDLEHQSLLPGQSLRPAAGVQAEGEGVQLPMLLAGPPPSEKQQSGWPQVKI
jgi:hypothetical protein